MSATVFSVLTILLLVHFKIIQMYSIHTVQSCYSIVTYDMSTVWYLIKSHIDHTVNSPITYCALLDEIWFAYCEYVDVNLLCHKLSTLNQKYQLPDTTYYDVWLVLAVNLEEHWSLSPIRPWVGATKPVSSILLVSEIFSIVKSHIRY